VALLPQVAGAVAAEGIRVRRGRGVNPALLRVFARGLCAHRRPLDPSPTTGRSGSGWYAQNVPVRTRATRWSARPGCCIAIRGRTARSGLRRVVEQRERPVGGSVSPTSSGAPRALPDQVKNVDLLAGRLQQVGEIVEALQVLHSSELTRKL
jgi:hypothetical protein